MPELITLKDKIRFALLPKKQYLGYQARRASRRGEPELELLKFLIPRGRNAIDGGTHKGIYSWYLSKFCAQIHAFEPNPIMFNYLRQSVPDNVSCYEAALSKETGHATFHIPTSKGRFHVTIQVVVPESVRMPLSQRLNEYPPTQVLDGYATSPKRCLAPTGQG